MRKLLEPLAMTTLFALAACGSPPEAPADRAADTSAPDDSATDAPPSETTPIDPPARDRDPAKGRGQQLTASYLAGSWVAKGVAADCGDPDFSIRRSSGGLVMEADISNHDDNALVVIDRYPRLDLDAPMPDLPLESRSPDGLAILRPATDAAYDPVRIGSAAITGDGVVFVKCSG